MTDAKFRINGDSGDAGFDATASQVLTVTLKTLPLVGVRTWKLQVFAAASFDPNNGIASNPPRSSTGAPELSIVGQSTGQYVPVAPSGSATITLPASSGHSWILRSVINDGQKQDARGRTVAAPELIHQRMIAIRDPATNARKIVATETREYSVGGWCDAINDALGIAGSSDYPGVPIQRYLPAASGNMANAVSAALLANPTARRFVFPAGAYVWTRTLRPVDGLRADLIFEGHSTVLRRLNGSGVSIFFQFTVTAEPTDRIHFEDVEFVNEDPIAVVHAIYAYICTRVTARRVKLRVPTITPGSSDGTRLSWTCNTAHDCAFVEGFLERAQVGFCGIGSSSRNTIFAHNTGKDCTDFMVSIVGGNIGDSSDYIQNSLISNNVAEGVCGGGLIFWGSDGGGALAVGKIEGIHITDNILRGAKSVTFPTTYPVPIRGHLGEITRNIRIANNDIAVSGGDNVGGLYIASSVDSGPFENIRIEDNDIDQSLATTFLDGIDLPFMNGIDMYIRRNRIRGGRGCQIGEMDRLFFEDNHIIGGRLSLQAHSRNVTGWRLRRNTVASQAAIVGAFTSAVTFSSSGNHNVSDCIAENNEWTTDSADAIAVALGSGVLQLQLLNNPKLFPLNPATASLRAAITRAVNNPDFTL